MADVDEVGDEVEEAGPARSAETAALWAELRVDPIEIALPGGVGYTLRAYRSPEEITLSEVEREEDDFAILERSAAGDGFDDEDEDEDLGDGGSAEDGTGKDADETSGDETSGDETSGDETDEDADAVEAEDVPVLLGQGGRLYLFRTPEGLVEFVREGAPNDLAQLDTWAKLRERIAVDHVVPDEADRYELDLVVENLRGGHGLWDLDLLIRAGEIARDLGYALQIRTVLSALAPGSPLDDLDESLRAATGGGVGKFLARRKLRKIGAQQATLGWRTIIGKISAVVDWRE